MKLAESMRGTGTDEMREHVHRGEREYSRSVVDIFKLSRWVTLRMTRYGALSTSIKICVKQLQLCQAGNQIQVGNTCSVIWIATRGTILPPQTAVQIVSLSL